MLRHAASLSPSLCCPLSAPCYEVDLGAALEQFMRIWEEDTVCHAVPLQHFASLEKFSENKSRNALWFMHCLERQGTRKQGFTLRVMAGA